MKLRFVGLITGLLIFIILSFIAQPFAHQSNGFLLYFQNAAFLFNFTSLLVPAIISSLIFPGGGIYDIFMIIAFSFAQFGILGYMAGKLLERR